MADEPSRADAPPSYAMATGSSASSHPTGSHLEVPGSQNGIPALRRRSMEDESRPLPDGWIRQFDAKEQHQFFVDTRATPPKSIWHHPYDDETYLSTLSSEERERLQEEEHHRMERLYHTDDDTTNPSKASKASAAGAGATGAAASVPTHSTGTSSFDHDLPPRPNGSQDPRAKKRGFGERFKEKVTGLTKEERAEEKRQREQEEREYYQAHVRFRQCLQQAQITGQPQFFARDRDGKEIYIEPPNVGGHMPYGGGYGYSPYNSGPYANPNARFIRPQNAYNRPYGSGYGGGYGLPIAGGLLGGMLLGGLLF